MFVRKTPTAELVAAVDAVLDGGVQWVERVKCAEDVEVSQQSVSGVAGGDVTCDSPLSVCVFLFCVCVCVCVFLRLAATSKV